jgi:hypothetical protein
MKAAIRSLIQFKLAAFAIALAGAIFAGAPLAWSQDANAPTLNTPIQHVIVVIQENRTPDNLFGSDLNNSPHRLPQGADLASSGKCKNPIYPPTVILQPGPLQTCVDPNHSHTGGFEVMYDKESMDDVCDAALAPPPSGCGTPVTCKTSAGATYPCQYQFVQNNIPPNKTNGTLDPYFNIAHNYGYANYMFQTNQGPSFPAHQFLFGGTSAPVKYPTDLMTGSYKWFDTENVYGPLAGTNQTDPYFHGQSGCLAPTWDPNGNVTTIELDPTLTQYKIFPCYDHKTMADLVENSVVS